MMIIFFLLLFYIINSITIIQLLLQKMRELLCSAPLKIFFTNIHL